MSPRRVIGVDAGGTKLLVGVVDDGLKVEHRTHALWPKRGCEEVVEQIAAAVATARDAAPDCVAVGLGIPSLVDSRTGESRLSVHLALDRLRVAEVVAERVGLPVTVDNDANAAMLVEHRHGAARETDYAALLTIGTGIGGALVVGGRLYRGADGYAGELGHIVVDHSGPPCFGDCPGRGCLEAGASGSAIGRLGEERARSVPGSKLGSLLSARGSIEGSDVTDLAIGGDPDALAIVEVAGRWLGAGLVTIVNAFNPRVVVVGGGVMRLGELLLAPARAVLVERALAPAAAAASVVAAEFGEDAGMIGAGLMALDGDAPGGPFHTAPR